jgi:vitamin B12 transporter
VNLQPAIAWGACAFLLSAAPVVRAEEPPSGEPITLDEVVVRVPRGELAQAPAAAATVIDASRFAGEAKGVAELLAVSPGVDVQRYGAAGQLATVSVRGVAADGVKVLLDGLPLGSAAGYVDLSTIPRAWIRRVEVVRGPAGAAFGAGALGGAVNVVTRDASGVEGEASAGSFGTYALSADAGAEVGRFRLLVGATGERTRGDFKYRWDRTPSDPDNDPLVTRTASHDASQRGGLLLKLGGEAGNYRLDALAQVSGGHRQLPASVLDLDPSPRSWQADGRALAMARLARQVAPGLDLSVRVHGQGDLLDVRPSSQQGALSHQRGAAGGLQLEAGYALRPAQLTAVASADAERWTGTALGGPRSRGTVAGALAGDVRLGSRLHLGPAVRLERTGRFTGLSANLGARLDLPADLRLRASAGRTVRIPTFTELYLQQGMVQPNPSLSPERGVSGDAALVYDGAPGFLSLGAFVQRNDDIITYERVSSAGIFKPINTPAALMRGLELEGATAPLRRAWNLSLQAAWTVLRSELLAGAPGIVGNQLPRRPGQQLFARASVEPAPAEAHLELRRVGRQYRDEHNLDPIAVATTWGAGASVTVARAPRLSVHLQVDNLTDRRDLVDGFGNPLPGRSVMVTLRAGASDTGAP